MAFSISTSLLLLLAQAYLTCAAPISTIQSHSTTSAMSTILRRFLHADHDDDDSPKDDPEDDPQQHSHLADSLTPANQYAPQWPFLVAKILAGIAGLVAIFIIVFFLHRRYVRARRRRIGEMMGLNVMRNEVLAGKHGQPGSQRWGREERKGHVRLHSCRWGGRRDESSSGEESDLEEGRSGHSRSGSDGSDSAAEESRLR